MSCSFHEKCSFSFELESYCQETNLGLFRLMPHGHLVNLRSFGDLLFLVLA